MITSDRESAELEAFVAEFPTLADACRFQSITVLAAERDGTLPTFALKAVEGLATLDERADTWRWLAERAREARVP